MSQFNREKWDNGGPMEYLPQIFIPWEMIEPHEKQSQKNHYQSLKRIAERGGFSRCEAIAVLEDREWTNISVEEADRILKEMVVSWIAKQKTTCEQKG